MLPVNKVPYDGPRSFRSIRKAIVEEAIEKGWDFITPAVVTSVIRYMFSKGGALKSIPFFLTTHMPLFGRWIPSEEGKKIRRRFIKARKKHRWEIHIRAKKIKRYRATFDKYYDQYLENSMAEVPMNKEAWLIATKRTAKLKKMNREIYTLRRRWQKKLKTYKVKIS
jgi:hypothetical protein